MKTILKTAAAGLVICFLLFASSITTGLLIQQAGTPQGSIGTINCSTGVTCNVAAGVATVTSNGGVSGLTPNCIPEAATATTLTNSTVCDNGTVLTVTGRNINMPGGSGVISWNSDTGLSRSSSGNVNVGNGTAGDASGTVNLANVVASASNKSPIFRPITDGPCGTKFTNVAASQNILCFDTVNFRLGLNKTPGAYNFDNAGSYNSGTSGGNTGLFSLTGKTSGNAVNITVADATAAGGLTAPGVNGTLDYVASARTAGRCAQFDSDGIGLVNGPPCNTGLNFRGIGSTFNGGGSALTNGTINYFTVPYACTISAWNATVDTGTITFDVWKIATGTAIPTVTNTIVASANPAIASGTALHSTTLTGWTTSVAQNDIFAFQIKTTSGPTNASLVLECDQ